MQHNCYIIEGVKLYFDESFKFMLEKKYGRYLLHFSSISDFQFCIIDIQLLFKNNFLLCNIYRSIKILQKCLDIQD